MLWSVETDSIIMEVAVGVMEVVESVGTDA